MEAQEAREIITINISRTRENDFTIMLLYVAVAVMSDSSEHKDFHPEEFSSGERNIIIYNFFRKTRYS